MAKQLNDLGDKLLEVYPLAKVEGRAHHILVKVEGELPTLADTHGASVWDTSAYDKQIEEMGKAIEDCKLRGEAIAKERDDLKNQLDAYIAENKDLNKQLEAKTKDCEKVAKELEKVKAAIKVLE